MEQLTDRAAAIGLPLRAETLPLEGLPGGRFDTVVSVFDLISCADLAVTLRELRRVLGPGGLLLVVEPFPGHRVLDRALGATGRLWPVTRGLHLDRAIASALREEGFVFTGVQRMTIRTPVWPLRNVMAAVARAESGPESEEAGPDGPEGSSGAREEESP